MQGYLNSFQKSMLQWNELHPYNAVHVAQLRGTLDMPRLLSSLKLVLGKHGLGRLDLDRPRNRYEYGGEPAECQLQTITSGQGGRHGLASQIESQLNLRFDCAKPFSPFRFLAAPTDDGFYVGVAYFHAAADAVAVVWLLKEIAAAYSVGQDWTPRAAIERYPNGGARWLWHHPQVVVRKLLALPGQAHRLRRSHRPRYEDANDMANGFSCFSLGPEERQALIATARSWDATVNDLFLALLLKSLSPCAAERVRAERRKQISVGCIVNLRPELGLPKETVFGVLLGSFIVTHEVPPGISLRQLATEIRQQTMAVKRRQLYLGTPLELALGRFLLGFLSAERRRKAYAKNYPLWGGITNLNLNRLWEPTGSAAPIDYFRGVSTGPVIPLALSVTTVGERINLGVSYRTTVFSRKNIEQFQSRLREQVQEACVDS